MVVPAQQGIRAGLYRATMVLVFGLGLVPPLLRAPTSDDAWLMYLARQVLSGARLGIDYVEVTPPLAIWKSIPAVLLESATGVSAWTVTILMIGALAALSLVLLRRFLIAQPLSTDQVRLLILATAFGGLVIPGVEFSEREQFAFLLTVPYVGLTASRAFSGRIDTGSCRVAGVLAALGFSLKPHYLIPLVLVEAFAFTRDGFRRWRFPEVTALLLTGTLTAVATLVFAPRYVETVLRLAPWYTAYLDNGFLYTLGLAGPMLLAIGPVVLAHRAAVPEPVPLRDMLGLAFLGYLLGAVAQRKGLSYHFLAAWGYGVILLTVVWQTQPVRLSRRPSGLLLRGGLILLALITVRAVGRMAIDFSRPREVRHRGPDYSELLARTRALGAGESLLLMSSNPATAWPFALEAGGRWGSRYPCFWLLGAFYAPELRSPLPRVILGRPSAERAAAERDFVEEVLYDLETRRPRVLIVLTPSSTAGQWGGAGRFDYLAYFGRESRFVSLMAEYAEVDPVGGYRIWVRSPR